MIGQVQKALENTIATFTSFDGETAVGMVQLIGDGGMSFYIKDFCIPFNWRKDFNERYLSSIRFICLAMTDEYIKSSYEKESAKYKRGTVK